MFKYIIEDLKKKSLWYYDSTAPVDILKILLTDGTPAMILYRLAQWFQRMNLGIFASVVSRFNAILTGALIGRKAKFGKGFVILHSIGVVINSEVEGGENIVIEHCVTIGAEKKKSPRLGNNIFIGAGAKIISGVRIGNNVKIGANAVVVKDVPDNATVVGVPARVVKVNNKKNKDPFEMAGL